MKKPINASKLLEDNWQFVQESYQNIITYQEQNSPVEEDNDEMFSSELLNIFYEEWKLVYPMYVKSIVEKDVIENFRKVQLHQMEKDFKVSFEINKFVVMYYLAGYFNIYIRPFNQIDRKHEDIRFRIAKDYNINQDLYDIFGEMWNQVAELVNIDIGIWDEFDLGEYYDVEESFLQNYLSECWNKVKRETNTNAKAILSEHTGVGEIFYLDEKRILKDIEDFLN